MLIEKMCCKLATVAELRKLLIMVGRLYFTGKLNLVSFTFHMNPEILEKLFNLIFYL